MSTLVCFHAHPDDEAIATAGLMMGAVDAGHRVVLVVATRGEGGLVPDDLAAGEYLGDRRTAEQERAAEMLGVHRLEWLEYGDSGMAGEATNDDPGCFWQADVDDAAGRLAALLEDEAIDVLTIYDDHGGYDHPDHIAIHRVGTRFAEMRGVANVYWATMNRDLITKQMETMRDATANMPDDDPGINPQSFGMAEADITHRVDARPYIDRKRAAMVAHASQITEDTFFLQIPPPVFEAVFGDEWFHAPGKTRDDDFIEGLFN